MNKPNGFKRGSGCYVCGECGKRTRDTQGEGQSGLCLRCFEISGIENSHLDGVCHQMGVECPFCLYDAGQGPDPYTA